MKYTLYNHPYINISHINRSYINENIIKIIEKIRKENIVFEKLVLKIFRDIHYYYYNYRIVLNKLKKKFRNDNYQIVLNKLKVLKKLKKKLNTNTIYINDLYRGKVHGSCISLMINFIKLINEYIIKNKLSKEKIILINENKILKELFLISNFYYSLVYSDSFLNINYITRSCTFKLCFPILLSDKVFMKYNYREKIFYLLIKKNISKETITHYIFSYLD
jgi:hypothetical protein